jgi:hypothetical protein
VRRRDDDVARHTDLDPLTCGRRLVDHELGVANPDYREPGVVGAFNHPDITAPTASGPTMARSTG